MGQSEGLDMGDGGGEVRDDVYCAGSGCWMDCFGVYSKGEPYKTSRG